jgi:hypothetical protein
MMNRFSPHRRPSLRGLLRRIDKVAGDLNVLLVVFALGLAVLDMTFFVAQNVIEELPPLASITYPAPPSAAN